MCTCDVLDIFGIIIVIIIIIIVKQTENYRKEIVSRVWGVW